MRIQNSYLPVSGVGETREQRLWEAGLYEWAEFSPKRAPVGPKTTEAIESFISEASVALDDADTKFFQSRLPSSELWRIYENVRSEALFFDIETTGLDARRNTITTVSFYQGNDTTTLVRDDTLTEESLRTMFANAPLIISFNGAQFDVPFIETNYSLDIDTPHLDLRYPCKQVNLTGGLKSIEQAVGISRDLEAVDGQDAVRLWYQYERENDDFALEKLIQYNQADTVNLKALTDIVVNKLHNRSLGAVADLPCGVPDPR